MLPLASPLESRTKDAWNGEIFALGAALQSDIVP